MGISIDVSQIAGFAETMDKAPELFAQELVIAFNKFGKATNEDVRANASSGLRMNSRGTPKVFKYKAADKDKINGSISRVFVDFFSKWKAAGMFETGGTVKPAVAGALTILTENAKGKSGRRRWTSQEIVQKVDAGEFRLVKNPNRWLIVQSKGGLTKTGKPRKGTRDEIIAILQKSAKIPKRIAFTATVESNMSLLLDLTEVAIENVNLKLSQQDK